MQKFKIKEESQIDQLLAKIKNGSGSDFTTEFLIQFVKILPNNKEIIKFNEMIDAFGNDSF